MNSLAPGSKTPIYLRGINNGTGMSEEVQQRIFDHLFTTKGVNKGTGLGLAIAKQIIDEHNGQINCSSISREGTKFIITLPI
ncbi:MAG: HAMP domain-containing histidine kinase [Nostocaceae cyanobacterium]|nr:HAMP domain-containing histidine kinase [Nostocaceae cyanobacterium]